jgi:adenosylcobinamide-GDP ribazoletransferase
VTTALLTAARNEVAFQLWLEPAGTVGLVLLLLARVALLASVAAVSEPAVIAVLFAAPVISRFVPLAIAHWHEGPSAPPGALRVPALWCVLPLLLLVPAGGLRVLLLALVGAALATLVLYRAASGRNASGLHASLQQVCEAGFYLGAAIAA